ncbi:ABC-type metal ion transport system, periplasmic component/surface adhesin [Archaeoglobus sulfaticallidus PM70-1]|uniref:ABC-type metal ion transport system, periplasmic component/surface adhesin n=1 Tax=Archaeoglobus sulfaticallidus PM70-1 TaxID=387631 RepID=N0BN98_9EURY|nr:zinc ABC transporter substrate-binding protein [Archaeoglobus sulfaticallidus]AGK62101.1 ABC-type metal ion transport system, periplasmic component/surface adhesin [Archaeoglobus sulfaticallidus PM70-1]
MHKITWMFTLALMIALISPVSALKIVCTNPDFAQIVKEIAEDAEVESLMPSGSDPHTFSVTKEDMLLLESADLIVLTNSELLNFEVKIKEQYGDKTLDFEDYREYGAKLLYFDDYKNLHGYWLYLDNALAIAKAIEDRLEILKPELRDTYRINLKAFEREILSLKEVSGISKERDMRCVAVIPGVTYIMKNAGVDTGAILLEEGSGFVSGKEYSDIQSKLKSSEFKCIVVPASMKDSKAGEIALQLSRDTGKPVVYVKFVSGDSSFLAQHIYNLMQFNIEKAEEKSEDFTLPLIVLAIIEAVIIVWLRLRG